MVNFAGELILILIQRINKSWRILRYCDKFVGMSRQVPNLNRLVDLTRQTGDESVILTREQTLKRMFNMGVCHLIKRTKFTEI